MNKEANHIKAVLENAQKALLDKNSMQLKDLSNQTVHTACQAQDPGSITIAVLLYALSKLIERADYDRIKNWDQFVKKFNSLLSLAAQAIGSQNQEAYEKHLQKARTTLESVSVNLRPYIKEIIRKSCINKASKLYEHGLSLGKTSQLLGATQWEISEFAGQKNMHNPETVNVKKRAKTAMEFLK